METKQTAVEWLLHNLDLENMPNNKNLETLNKAFDLETKQIFEAFKAGWMRANAQTWDDSYFITYLKSLDNDDNL